MEPKLFFNGSLLSGGKGFTAHLTFPFFKFLTGNDDDEKRWYEQQRVGSFNLYLNIYMHIHLCTYICTHI